MDNHTSYRRFSFPWLHAWARTVRAVHALGNRSRLLVPGISLCAVIAIMSIASGHATLLAENGISSLIIAMTLGIILGNSVLANLAARNAEGVLFAKQNLLRFGIVLYGVRLTVQDIAQVGVTGVVIDLLVVVTTFALAVLIGRRFLKIDEKIVILIGAGSSICGAAAVLATNSLVKGKSAEVTVAIATVVIFGTIATFLYPVLYRLDFVSEWIATSPATFGIYTGSTIHEVAQVVATARAIDATAVDAAVIAKMVRVMMLCPFLFCLAVHLAVRARGGARRELEPQPSAGLIAMIGEAVPWFAVWFITVVGINSIGAVPARLIPFINQFDTLLLVMAMAALGLGTRFSAFRQAGVRPLLLGALLFVWLIAGGALINYFVADLFR